MNLRIERAWVWADLDRIDAALAEARVLLPMAYGRLTRHRAALLRVLIGYCHLHRGHGPAALREMLLASNDSAAGPRPFRWTCARHLVDAILDLEAWNVMEEAGGALAALPEGGGVQGSVTFARAQALLASEKGGHAAAVDRLEAGRGLLDRIPSCVARARYLHHLGLASLRLAHGRERGRAGMRAEWAFQTELGVLPTSGARYWRGRALLSLALAQRVRAKRSDSEATLDAAAALAARIQSRRLLADCLSARGRAG